MDCGKQDFRDIDYDIIQQFLKNMGLNRGLHL